MGFGGSLRRTFGRARDKFSDVVDKGKDLYGRVENQVSDIGHSTGDLFRDPHQWTTDHQRELNSMLGPEFAVTNAIGAAPGDQKDYVFGGNKAYQDEKAYGRELFAQKREQQNIDRLRGQANAQFGVGASPEAMANASRLRAARGGAMQSFMTAGRSDADAEYGGGLVQNRINLARSGLTGSGIDTQNRGNLLSNYYNRLSQTQTGANQLGQQFDQNLQGGRQSLLGSINRGRITDTTGMRADASSMLSTNPYASALGHSIGDIGQGIVSNRLAAAYKK